MKELKKRAPQHFQKRHLQFNELDEVKVTKDYPAGGLHRLAIVCGDVGTVVNLYKDDTWVLVEVVNPQTLTTKDILEIKTEDLELIDFQAI